MSGYIPFNKERKPFCNFGFLVHSGYDYRRITFGRLERNGYLADFPTVP